MYLHIDIKFWFELYVIAYSYGVICFGILIKVHDQMCF